MEVAEWVREQRRAWVLRGSKNQPEQIEVSGEMYGKLLIQADHFGNDVALKDSLSFRGIPVVQN